MNVKNPYAKENLFPIAYTPYLKLFYSRLDKNIFLLKSNQAIFEILKEIAKILINYFLLQHVTA